MIEHDILKIFVSIIIGAVVGLETETREVEKKGEVVAQKEERERIGGVRTFTILSLFGGIAGLFYEKQIPFLSYVMFLVVFGFTLAAYVLNVQYKKAFGITTELAIIVTFLLGFLTTSSILPVIDIIAFLVFLVLFLSQKRGINVLIKKFAHYEVIDVIKFALVGLVILPLLPNESFTVSKVAEILSTTVQDPIGSIILINPFQTWFLVVLISGINLIGYILSKILGSKKSLLIIATISGFVSSTAATISFANKSKTDKNLSKSLASYAILANGTSFILVSLLIWFSSKQLFSSTIFIMLAMLIGSVIISFAINAFGKRPGDIELKYQPFSLVPALKFVSLIVILQILIQSLQRIGAGSIVVLIITAVSGITGIDPAAIALSSLVSASAIDVKLASLAFVFANVFNLLAKILYAKLYGNKTYFKYIAIGLGIISIIALLGWVVSYK